MEAKHTFQSFWAGEALSPYEFLCLKSFIDCGHAFHLYTFDSKIAVPFGVRVCDASKIIDPQEFFVYEHGFGTGSPAGFATLFRYKLLVETGGWWVDTDVICLSKHIPYFKQFFASQDENKINNAILFFEPQHPVTIQCFKELLQIGRSMKWGEPTTLFTRAVKELGFAHCTLPSSVCYPIHYSEALDLLRPSKLTQIRERTTASIFVHLWNQMLRHRGVQKSTLPPEGSQLRQWIEQYQVTGWKGEYDEQTLEYVFSLQEGNSELSAKLNDFMSENERLRAEMRALLSSTSWQITEPLRMLTRQTAWLRGLIGRF